MLTKKQAALFWRCLAAAAERQAVPDREAYRKRVLREELGIEHMRDIGRTGDFDRLMLRLAQDAEDWQSLAYYSVAGERRLIKRGDPARIMPLAFVHGRRWFITTTGTIDFKDPPGTSPAFRVNILSA